MLGALFKSLWESRRGKEKTRRGRYRERERRKREREWWEGKEREAEKQ